MNIEKMREDFKAWAITTGFEDHHFWLRDDGDYADYDVRRLWHPWQASRAAIEVELPEEGSMRGDGHWFDIGVEACKEAIESLGLKVK